VTSLKVGLQFKQVKKNVDQSTKIFENTKKGKEKEKFDLRHALPPKAPQKLLNNNPKKAYFTKGLKEFKLKKE
jgi:hypothetical protein